MIDPHSSFVARTGHFLSSKKFLRHTTAAIVMLTLTTQSWAWGREGHRLTALVAQAYLTPATKAEIVELLGKETLADVAPWADSYRTDHPESAPWHFVDIPKSAAAYDRVRDCPEPAADPKSPWRDCAPDRILYFEGRLGDTSLSPAERAIALKFLVHLIGDIHQPFHAMGDDRGGNNITVDFLGSPACGSYKCNLHGVWDDSMIEERGLSEAKYTALLLQEIKENNLEHSSGGAPSTWANLSHQYAVDAYAPNGALLMHDYYNEEIKVVDRQLALGGLRLARVLNRILGDATPASPDRTPLPKPADTAAPTPTAPH